MNNKELNEIRQELRKWMSTDSLHKLMDRLTDLLNTRPQKPTSEELRKAIIDKYGHNDHFTDTTDNLRRKIRKAIKWALSFQPEGDEVNADCHLFVS